MSTRADRINKLFGQNISKPINIRNQYHINRPESYAGTTQVVNKQSDKAKLEAPLKPQINDRSGYGNGWLIRPNFLAPDIKPRQVDELKQLQAISISEAREKATTTKTTDETVSVQVPDPTDGAWLAERARLERVYRAQFRGITRVGPGGRPLPLTPAEITKLITREISVNPPLGRNQRTMTVKTRNVLGNTTTDKGLMAIAQLITEGRAESHGQTAIIRGQLTTALRNIDAINNLTMAQTTAMGRAITRLALPTTLAEWDLPRFIDIDGYLTRVGNVNLYLLAKAGNTGRPNAYNTPVLNFHQRTGGNAASGLPGISLPQMIARLRQVSRTRFFLDLGRGGIISRNQFRRLVRTEYAGLPAFDDPTFTADPRALDFDINPANV